MSEKKENFEEFFEANFKIEYIADGDWNKITFCDQEFGVSYSPDYEIENFKRICETTWNHRQKKLDQAEARIRELEKEAEYYESIADQCTQYCIDEKEAVKALEKQLSEKSLIISEALIFLNCVKGHNWPELDNFLRRVEKSPSMGP